MSFEIMLINSTGAQKAATQEGQTKAKAAGTESAFQALMSLALTALFGGGAEAQVIAKTETAAVEAAGAAGDRAAQVTVAGADAEMLWTPQGGTAGETPVGQEFPVVGESRCGEAQVAGPVEVANGATETGGHTEPTMQDLPHSASSNALMVAQRSAVTGNSGAAAMSEPTPPESAWGPALETAYAGAAQTTALTVSVAETTDAAVAPDYRFQSYGGRDAVTATDKQGEPLRSPHTDGEAATPIGERPSVAAKAGFSIPEGKTPASEPRNESGDGEPFANAEKMDTDETPVLRQPAEPKTGIPDFVVTEQPQTNETSASHESLESRSLRDARAISQTLLEESLKRLPRSIELTLDPPRMGSVTALLSQRGQDVTVKFVAHTNEGQRMLQAATEDLARSLGEKGLVLTGFSVDPGYRDDRGQERRENTGKPSTSRYGRVSRLAAVAAGVQVRQVGGSFNWLA